MARDAVRRGFQTLSVNRLNFGLCINIAVDEQHLHLQPAKAFGWLGARPASIPWDAIEIQKPGSRWITARCGPHRIKGPAWCMKLAGTPG